MKNRHVLFLLFTVIGFSVINIISRVASMQTPDLMQQDGLLPQVQQQTGGLEPKIDTQTSSMVGKYQQVGNSTLIDVDDLTSRLQRSEGQQEKQPKEIENLSQKIDTNKLPVLNSRHRVDTTQKSIVANLRSNPTKNGKKEFKPVPAPPSIRDMHGTVVTAYFELPSKHSNGNYMEWMLYMLSIDDPVIIFTTSDWVDRMKTLRSHATNRTTIIETTLDELQVATNYNESVWKNQFTLDPIGRYRKSYRLYWIWLSKTHFLNEAIQLNPYDSTHFMWMDIGCFRSQDLIEKFANKTVMRHLERIPNASMLMMAHITPVASEDPWFSDKTGCSKYFYTSGSSFAGTKETTLLFHKQFLKTMQGYLDRGLFIGEDQIILQSTCMQNHGLCQFVQFKEVQPRDVSYFALRTVLRFGGDHYNYWKPPRLN